LPFIDECNIIGQLKGPLLVFVKTLYHVYWQAANPMKPLNVGKNAVNIAVYSLVI